MSEPASTLPPLRFSDLQPGRRFGPTPFPTSAALVDDYVAVTGDDNPIYRDAAAAAAAGFAGPVLPPGLAGVWGRLAYLGGYRMLPGGVMAGQHFELLRPALVGDTLRLEAEVLDAGPDPERRSVVLRAEAHTDEGLIGVVTIDARWPADEDA